MSNILIKEGINALKKVDTAKLKSLFERQSRTILIAFIAGSITLLLVIIGCVIVGSVTYTKVNNLFDSVNKTEKSVHEISENLNSGKTESDLIGAVITFLGIQQVSSREQQKLHDLLVSKVQARMSSAATTTTTTTTVQPISCRTLSVKKPETADDIIKQMQLLKIMN